MRKIDKMVQSLEADLQHVREQGSMLEQGIAQAQQQLREIVARHDGIVHRISALKEVAEQGESFLAEVPDEGPTTESEQAIPGVQKKSPRNTKKETKLKVVEE